MGKRVPKPTPTKTLKDRGSWLAKTRKNEPEPGVFDDSCPDYLGERGQAVWFQLIPILRDMGILGSADRLIVIAFCFWWGEFLRLTEECPNDTHMIGKATDYVLKLSSRLGLSPADRVGLKVDKEEKDKSKRFFKVG